MDASKIYNRLSERQQHRTSLENVVDVIGVCPVIPGSMLLNDVCELLDKIAFEHFQNCESGGKLYGDEKHYHERITAYAAELRGWVK